MPKVKYTSSKGLVQESGTGQIDLGPPASVKILADGAPQIQTLVWLYDHAVDGTAAAETTLKDVNGAAQSIPRGFVLLDGWAEVITAVTSSGAGNVDIGTAGTSNDPNGFFAVVPKGTLAIHAVVPANGALVSRSTASGTANSGTHVLLARKKIVTSADPVTITSSHALTAGKFYFFLRGYMSSVVA